MEKIYNLINKDNGARVRSTEKFLVKWFALGFEVVDFYMGTILPEEEAK